MLTKQTWNDFQRSGLLWWVNRILHTFGWAIVFVMEDNSDTVLNVYPARCSSRGFTEELDDKGFAALHQYLKDHINEIQKETEDNR